MSYQLKRRAVRHFSSEYVPLKTNKFNRRAWLRSVDMLGDKWLYRNAVPLAVLAQQVRK